MKISIDGPIGAGKSSLLSRLCKETRLPVFLEPVDDWKDWLSLFYSDPARWGMSFNINVLLTFNQWKNNDFLSFYERSPISNRYVFSELQHEQGRMNDLELSLFERVYDKLAWTPDVVVYIRTTPEVSMERMRKRGRECENEVPLEYHQAIFRKYEEIFLPSAANKKNNCTVIVIDGNRSHDEVYADVLAAIKPYF